MRWSFVVDMLLLGSQEQLQESQEALRNAKAESARRLKSLQSMQQQVRQLPIHTQL